MENILQIQALIRMHQLIRNKYIPEIEQQFTLLLNEVHSINPVVKQSYLKFCSIKKDLFNHFDEEEKFVFPLIHSIESNEHSEFNSTFLQLLTEHHISEGEVQVVLQLLQLELNSIGDYFPYRILIHKLNHFQDIVQNHKDQEEELFQSVRKELAKIGKLESKIIS